MDEGLGQRCQIVNKCLVAIGKSLVVATVTLLEKRIEGLAVVNRDYALRNEMQSKHRLYASMGRGGNMMFQQQSLRGIETGIIQTVDSGIVVSPLSQDADLLYRLVGTLHTVAHQSDAALLVKCLFHILTPSFITLT